MSSNRLIYDNCEYKTKLNESTNPLNYMLNPIRYENCNKCRMELGIVGGTATSHIQGNLVDLETDFMGITRKASLCPSQKFSSNCSTSNNANCNQNSITIKGDTCGKDRTIDTSLLHLPSCNMIRYKPTPLAPKLNVQHCNGN